MIVVSHNKYLFNCKRFYLHLLTRLYSKEYTSNILYHFLLGLNHFGTLDPSLLSTLVDWLILGTVDSSGILSIDLLPSLLQCNLKSFNLSKM